MRRLSARVAITVLAVGVATSASIFGSFAAWTASTDNPGNSVSSGTLALTNSKNGSAVFSATNVKPGDTGSDTVTIANTGNQPMAVTLSQDQVVNAIGANLDLYIHDDTTNRCVWPVPGIGACAGYGDWDASVLLSAYGVVGSGGPLWAGSESHTYTVAWRLEASAPNSTQNKTASFRLVWNGGQS